MSFKVLVVDDVEFNQKLLNAKLKLYYYQVFTASNGRIAIEKAREVQPDIILMDVMMPEMDGFEATQLLKADPELCYIPIIIITALSSREDKIRGLECGADDFLTKPIDDHSLISRLKSLARLKSLTDELKIRSNTMRQMGLNSFSFDNLNNYRDAKILLVDDDIAQVQVIEKRLTEATMQVVVCKDYATAVEEAQKNVFSAGIVSGSLINEDPLEVCANLKALDALKFMPLIIILEDDQSKVIDTALEIGVTDYIAAPIDPNELKARVITQVKRKNYQDELKREIMSSIEDSVKDPLSGLFNRRYFENHGANLISQANESSKPLAAVMIDIDHFKHINDTYGHQAGDAVIVESARRFMENIRMTDLVVRYGGEEFVILLPNTTNNFAYMVADRLRTSICDDLFAQPGSDEQIKVSISVGMAMLKAGESLLSVVERADKAMYQAKQNGRNQLIIAE